MDKGQVWVVVNEQYGIFLSSGFRHERADGSAIPVAVFFMTEQDAQDYLHALAREQVIASVEGWKPMKLLS